MKSESFYDPVYTNLIQVIYLQDNEWKKALKKAGKHIELQIEEKNDWGALCVGNYEDSLYTLLFKKQISIPYLVELITHETQHLMSDVYRTRGVQFSVKDKRQEHQAYYQGYLARETSVILEKFGAFK